MKRVIARLREARHGGTIIFVPMESAGDFMLPMIPYLLDLKYTFEPVAGQRSFADVVVSILNRLAAVHGSGPHQADSVGWQEFETNFRTINWRRLMKRSSKPPISLQDWLSADGAVVMNKHHDILGFGGIVSGGQLQTGEKCRPRDRCRWGPPHWS